MKNLENNKSPHIENVRQEGTEMRKGYELGSQLLTSLVREIEDSELHADTLRLLDVYQEKIQKLPDRFQGIAHAYLASLREGVETMGVIPKLPSERTVELLFGFQPTPGSVEIIRKATGFEVIFNNREDFLRARYGDSAQAASRTAVGFSKEVGFTNAENHNRSIRVSVASAEGLPKEAVDDIIYHENMHGFFRRVQEAVYISQYGARFQDLQKERYERVRLDLKDSIPSSFVPMFDGDIHPSLLEKKQIADRIAHATDTLLRISQEGIAWRIADEVLGKVFTAPTDSIEHEVREKYISRFIEEEFQEAMKSFGSVSQDDFRYVMGTDIRNYLSEKFKKLEAAANTDLASAVKNTQELFKRGYSDLDVAFLLAFNKVDSWHDVVTLINFETKKGRIAISDGSDEHDV